MPLGPLVAAKPLRLFEFCDLEIFPEFIRARVHEMLHLLWTHRVPIVQKQAPAEIAADIVYNLLDAFNDSNPYSHEDGVNSVTSENQRPAYQAVILDFCSGAGGPTAVIESMVNERRRQNGLCPIYVQLSDLRPQLRSWTELSRQSKSKTSSEHLGFIPEPVDAGNPPAKETLLRNARNKVKAEDENAEINKVVHLFCLGFHHFDNKTAKKVLTNSMRTADAFAIIELQDRHLSSFILLLLLTAPLVICVTALWTPFDPGMLILTYLIPIVPFVLVFDGLVSSLRTRTVAEIADLVGGHDHSSSNTRSRLSPSSSSSSSSFLESSKTKSKTMQDIIALDNGWVLRAGHQMHSWPVGYLNYVIGQKVQD